LPKGRFLRFCSLLMNSSLVLLAAGCNRLDVVPRPRPKGPSVLLVTIDTLRADYVGAMARHRTETPTLDRLISTGTLFERASATAPLTLPSHASILTGQYPPHHGIRHNSIYSLPRAAVTVAERFQEAGYATAAFVAAAVLGREFGLDQGFDVYADKMSERRANAGSFEQLSATQVTHRAREWLATTDRPFFAWVHYYDVHATYEPPEPFLSRLSPNPYAGEVAYVDHELGRLLDSLEASGREADTIVVVTADHGEGLGEHGEKTHSYLIYESTMHVPLIVRGPGIAAGRRVTDVVSNAAIAPTLVALAGLTALPETDVGELPGLRDGASRTEGWAYSESLAGQLDHGWAPIHAIRTGTTKFIRAPRPELFDLEVDPRERTNLLASPTAVESRNAEVALAEQRIDSVSANERAGERVAVDAETRARIEALGYVVPSAADTEAREGALDPKDVEQYSQLAFQSGELLATGQLEEAERVTRAAIEKLPQSTTLRENLTRLLLRTNRLAEALHAAEAAVRVAPESPWSRQLLGEVRLRLGDGVGGVAALRRALELDPDQAAAHLALISALRFGGDIGEAESHARRAIELGDRRSAIYEACGEAWQQVGEFDRAKAAYLEGLEMENEPKERLHMRLAIQFAREGDEESFAEHLALAGDAARDVPLATRLAIVFAARRDVSRAEPMFRALVMRDRARVAERMLARLLRENGRAREADQIAPANAPAVHVESALDRLAPAAAPRG
jgi:arylsulfatase A-like enzyme